MHHHSPVAAMVSMTFAAVALLATTALASCSASKPNFVFIMTDDQDMHLSSLAYQPSVQKHFAEQGTWFQKHFCTVSQCCPSRVSLLTGKAAHNTNVTDVTPPYGMSMWLIRSIHERQLLTIVQAGTQSSSARASMTTICQYGCRRQVIIRTTPESS